MHLSLTVNGTHHEVDAEPRTLLVDLIRNDLGLTGTQIGCDTTQCGACTVIVNGHAVKSCTVLAVQADGRGHHHRGHRPDGGCTPCRRPSGRSTASSAASARPG